MRALLLLAALCVNGIGYAATLTGSIVSSAASVDLATVGTLDWARWPGYKTKGAGQISDVTTIGRPKSYSNDPRIIGDRSGVSLSGAGATFELTVKATTSERTLIYYIGGWNSKGKVTVTLPNAKTYATSFSSSRGYSKVVTVKLRADSTTTARVRFTLVSGSGVIRMQAAALQGTVTSEPAPAPAPEPAPDPTPAPTTGSALLTWTPPTNNADGTPLADLSGFRVYWGQTPGAYSHSTRIGGAATRSYTVADLASGTWYFAVKALNSSGIESDFSNVASKSIP